MISSRLGISMVPEGRRLFGRLSVLDNLLLGAYAVQSKADVEKYLQSVFDLFPILKERQGQRSETFSGGEQQQLAIAGDLCPTPRCSYWMSLRWDWGQNWSRKFSRIVKEINARGVTVLLVEQNVYRSSRYFRPRLRPSNRPHRHGRERAGIAEERSWFERHTSACEWRIQT